MMNESGLDKAQAATRKAVIDRYCGSATLMVGAVHRAQWTIDDAREVVSELLSEKSEHVAWVSDPRGLGLEPSEQLVVLGLKGLTILPNGKPHREFGFKNVDKGVAERLTAALRRVTVNHPEPGAPRAWSSLTPESDASWLLFRAADVGRADLVLGLPLAEGKDPGAQACVVKTLQGKRIAGVRIASVHATQWTKLDLSPARRAALDAQAREALGALARSKALSIHLVVDGQVMTPGDEPRAESAPPVVSPELEAQALTRVVPTMNELAADVFDRPFRFEAITRDGERVTVKLAHQGEALEVVMRWSLPLAGERGEPSSAFIRELTHEVNQLFDD